MEKHYFTDHAVERFKERFGKHLVDGVPIKNSIARVFFRSEESRQHINDTRFMTEQYEKYGYSRIDVRVYEDIVFICRKQKVITVLPLSNRRYVKGGKNGKSKKAA